MPREQWAPLARRIEQITQGEFFPCKLDAQLEEMAQNYAALVINARSRQPATTDPSADYQSVLLGSCNTRH